MRLYFVAFLVWLVSCFSATGQVSTKDSTAILPTGFYKNIQQFREKQPYLNKPLIIDTLVYWANTDSQFIEYTYHFLDSSVNIDDWLFMYDGNNLYRSVTDGRIVKMEGVGLFPYYIHYYKKKQSLALAFVTAGVAGLGTGLLDRAVSGATPVLVYYNRKGELVEALPYTFAKFLKPDPDLYNEFEREKKYKIRDFIRYLDKMNERYPF